MLEGNHENMTTHSQTEMVAAIAEVATTMPLTRTAQLYEFALFLQSRSLTTDDDAAEIAADEALWDAQIAATDDVKLAALLASVEAEIVADEMLPMFDARGDFVEHR
jgi:hypothetical protein